MRACTRIAPVLLTLLPLACGGGQGNWQEFSSPEGGYSVLMPGAPRLEVRTNPGGLEMKNHVVGLKDGAYLVVHADLPPGRPFDFAPVAQGLAAKYDGKVLSESDFTLNGVTGRAIELQVGKPKGYASVRVVVVDGRLYELIVLGAHARASDPDVQKFFESFKLTK